MTTRQELNSAFDAWFDAEFYGVRLTDGELKGLKAAFFAGASLPSTGGSSIAHTDHPLRHFDRTCPACVAEASDPSTNNNHG